MKSILILLFSLLLVFTLSACSAKVGSPEWCAAMKKKPRGEWTVDELGDFTKNCLFK